MADAPLNIGDLSVTQDYLHEYGGPTFRAMIKPWLDGLGGAIQFEPESLRVVPGRNVDSPMLVTAGALGRTDLTSEATVYSTYTGSKGNRAPVVSRSLANPIEWREDAIRGTLLTPEQFAAKLTEDLAKQAARAVKVAWYNACLGAVSAVSTGQAHLSTLAGTATYPYIITAQSYLYDRRNEIAVCVIHPLVFASLEKDLLTGSNYHVFNVGDLIVYEGIGKFGKMRVIVDADAPVVVKSGSDYYYYTLMLCTGAGRVWMAPRTPLMTFVETPLDKGVRAFKAQVEVHAAVGVPGMDYNTTANPTEATLRTSGSWSEGFSFDHRDVGAVILRTING
jgi:hypothetical protein